MEKLKRTLKLLNFYPAIFVALNACEGSFTSFLKNSSDPGTTTNTVGTGTSTGSSGPTNTTVVKTLSFEGQVPQSTKVKQWGKNEFQFNLKLGSDVINNLAVWNLTKTIDVVDVKTSPGLLQFFPKTYPSTLEAFEVIATYEGKEFKSSNISVEVLGDPLSKYLWQVENTGANDIHKDTQVANEDINVVPALKKGFTGKGINLVVIDSGLEHTHPDLKNNYSKNISRDYTNSALSATNFLGDPKYDPNGNGTAHGTACAGLAAAEAWNGIGTRGVAPQVTLGGYNFLHGSAAGYDNGEFHMYTNNDDIHIMSQSYGLSDYDVATFNSQTYSLMQKKALEARGGKGAIIVTAAGNGKSMRETSSLDPDKTNPYAIVVGALNPNGSSTTYSTPGSAVFISAPAGEDGLISTDLLGCTLGFAGTREGGTSVPFDNGGNGNTENPTCDYTAKMNGTSAATPIVAGGIALLLEANPNLTQRDVKYILAKTATKTDPNVAAVSNRPGRTMSYIYDASVSVVIPADPTGYTAFPSWQVNKAGFNFHNFFGFGRLNVDAAIKMATTNYVSPFLNKAQTKIEQTQAANFTPVAVPDGSLNGASVTFAVPQDLVIEHVSLALSTGNQGVAFKVGELGIELRSPQQTNSNLITVNNMLSLGDSVAHTLNGIQFASNAFYFEKSKGDWTIKVIDGKSLANSTTQITGYRLSIYGHTP